VTHFSSSGKKVPSSIFHSRKINLVFVYRTALQLAEVDLEGGISPHVSPMTGMFC
jgi:hypothetical protein